MPTVVPMKLSVIETEDSFDPIARNPNLKVALHGVLQKYVVAYDRREGWLERLVRHDDRFVLVDGRVAIERVCGVVSAWIED